jgi:hypothetical protein
VIFALEPINLTPKDECIDGDTTWQPCSSDDNRAHDCRRLFIVY